MDKKRAERIIKTITLVIGGVLVLVYRLHNYRYNPMSWSEIFHSSTFWIFLPIEIVLCYALVCHQEYKDEEREDKRKNIYDDAEDDEDEDDT